MENIVVKSPITQQKLYEIREATDAEVAQVYSTARSVQPKIAAMTVEARVAEVLKLRDYLIDNRERFLEALIQETGKSLVDAYTSEMFEICDVIDVFRTLAPKALRDESVKTPIVLMGKKSKIVHEPCGVILVIPPWNYPLYQALVPGILAFLAGNATIVKPSEHTPLEATLREILGKSGFMQGAIQVVQGTGITGEKLIDARPDKIHFTGSTRTGRKIMARAAQFPIPVDLELGGKDPAIIFEDVDLERTVNGIMWGGLTNAGQSCTSVERVYVHEKIYEPFVKMLVEKASKLRGSTPDRNINDPEACDVGCITTSFQVDIIRDHIEDAVAKGAKLLLGGNIPQGSQHVPVTVLSGVNHGMKVMMEETFGPVLPVMPFRTEDEAIQLANDSPYGLSASVWSKDMNRCDRVMRKLKTGNVSINNHMLTEGNPYLPFGGVKDSGFGRYKGAHGLLTFTNSKSVLIDKMSNKIEPHWYPFTRNKYTLLDNIVLYLFSKSKSLFRFIRTGLKLDSIGNKEKIK